MLTFVAFPRQQRLHERASMLRYTYIACLLVVSNRPAPHFEVISLSCDSFVCYDEIRTYMWKFVFWLITLFGFCN